MKYYYPENRIKTGLYSLPGEFVGKDNNQSYVGPYWATFDNKYFSGSGPNATTYFELVKAKFSNITVPSFIETTTIICEDSQYLRIKNIDSNKTRKFPPSGTTFPKEDDTEFKRYFLRKINENTYFEVTKDIFDKIKSRSPEYTFELFETISFDWKIRGVKNDTKKANSKIVNVYLGLDKAINDNFIKYYKYPKINNLITEGNELQDSKGINYIGKYHIDEDKGFMMGTSDRAPILFAINDRVEDYLLRKIIGI